MAGIRESLMVPQEQIDELSQLFQTIDVDGNGFISVNELGSVLTTCGFKLSGFELRNIVAEYDTQIKDGKLDFEEFKSLYASLKKERDIGHGFRKVIGQRENVEYVGGTSQASVQGTTHSVRKEEQVAFSNWLNRNLADDPDCTKYLPIDPESRDLYVKCNDGILLCKMINKSEPGTIDPRTINIEKMSIYKAAENLTLALNSASSIGCNIVNIDANDLAQGTQHLVLGLLWQIIRIGLLSEINLHDHPGLIMLLREGETLEEFLKLSPEEILIRWVNYHLEKSGCDREIHNFSGDITDSVAYTHLLFQISPEDKHVNLGPLNENDFTSRADLMLQEADKIGCRAFVSAADVVAGNPKLNLAFVANLFNEYPALDKPAVEIDMGDLHEETREEKTYRNWMNSMGVSPYVNHLYSDLTDGLIIFQIYDKIQPGIVDWNIVIQKFKKIRMFLEKIENCNYAVKLGKEIKFSLVGIDGKDINDGNETLTLALVWQMMKAYTLSILAKLQGDNTHPVVDSTIIEWANGKLKSAGKRSSFRNFQDPALSTGHAVIDLIDALKPRSINYDLVKEGNNEQEKLNNAKYAISMSRKIGARVYALPEDIVEVKAKMIMTVFACLMIKDYQPKEAGAE